MRSSQTNDSGRGPGIGRRRLLRAAAGAALGVPAAALTGCGIFDRGPDEPPAPDPLAPLLAEALELAARHEAALTARPELAARLEPLVHAHRAHAAELARITGATPAPSASPTNAPAVGVPTTGDAAAVLAALREAERAGQATAAEACRTAPAERAALLGSIAAARATHVEVLT